MGRLSETRTLHPMREWVSIRKGQSMNTTTDTHLDSPESARPADVLSVEPARRSVELAFFRRITDTAKVTGAAILGKAAQAEGDTVAANLARMQSAAFKRLARTLEQSIPDGTGFGRFRQKLTRRTQALRRAR